MGDSYCMADNTIVDADNTARLRHAASDSNGSSMSRRAAGTQGGQQRLCKTHAGRYWLECSSERQGGTGWAEWLDDPAAARWMLRNGHELPADLATAGIGRNVGVSEGCEALVSS